MNRKARSASAPATKAPAKPIPNKLYFPIREVAELTGIEAYVLRFWEKEFPMLSPVKESSGALPLFGSGEGGKAMKQPGAPNPGTVLRQIRRSLNEILSLLDQS